MQREEVRNEHEQRLLVQQIVILSDTAINDQPYDRNYYCKLS